MNSIKTYSRLIVHYVLIALLFFLIYKRNLDIQHHRIEFRKNIQQKPEDFIDFNSNEFKSIYKELGIHHKSPQMVLRKCEKNKKTGKYTDCHIKKYKKSFNNENVSMTKALD